MATEPPVFVIKGTARRREDVTRQTADERTGVVREDRIGTRLLVLTDNGGFVDVYVKAEDDDLLPESLPAPIEWDAAVSIWRRSFYSDREKPREEQRTFHELNVRVVRPAGQAAPVQRPRAVASGE